MMSAFDTDDLSARARFMREMTPSMSSGSWWVIPTRRAIGTPRRVIVNVPPRSTDLSNSGNRVLASDEPTVRTASFLSDQETVYINQFTKVHSV